MNSRLGGIGRLVGAQSSPSAAQAQLQDLRTLIASQFVLWLLRESIERTPAVVDKVQAELPAGFSQVVAAKVMAALLAAARALEMEDGGTT